MADFAVIANPLSQLYTQLYEHQNLLHILLIIVSTPMVCGQYWVLGLFGWACLLFATFVNLPDKK